MVSLNFLFFWFIFMSYFFNFFSFLNSLLILESLSLLIFFSLMFCFLNFFSLSMIMFYFVFIVCESALGLSVLVKILKFFGSVNFCTISVSSF
nr:NADH dehydrogenase subunit 4L [Frankliniella intonsa]WKD82113.1 NADH dehydrogenase subunit 4L [Frankliniella intonsa]WKD82139.1 NADH dehydrogenase subunit 4L [Frankliniella intonsa]WKD82451.1 NADH dehydrogenase subunit 4L [Frankliniella intonsa]WKD82477.1 NADH dehydrogenase subunit 4L [Frankliniella intonsa]